MKKKENRKRQKSEFFSVRTRFHEWADAEASDEEKTKIQKSNFNITKTYLVETLFEIYIEFCTPPIAVRSWSCRNVILAGRKREIFILLHPLRWHHFTCLCICSAVRIPMLHENWLECLVNDIWGKITHSREGSNCFARWSAASLPFRLSMHADTS